MSAHTAALHWHTSTAVDIRLLAEWNHQLIRDEGHRNPLASERIRPDIECIHLACSGPALAGVMGRRENPRRGGDRAIASPGP